MTYTTRDQWEEHFGGGRGEIALLGAAWESVERLDADGMAFLVLRGLRPPGTRAVEKRPRQGPARPVAARHAGANWSTGGFPGVLGSASSHPGRQEARWARRAGIPDFRPFS